MKNTSKKKRSYFDLEPKIILGERQLQGENVSKLVRNSAKTSKRKTIKAKQAKPRNIGDFFLNKSISDPKSESSYNDSTTLFRFTLIVVSVVLYSNSLKCDFVYDDRRAIIENRNVFAAYSSEQERCSFANLWRSLVRIFTVDDFWGNPMINAGSHKSYRPLVTLSYRLQFELQRLFSSFVQWLPFNDGQSQITAQEDTPSAFQYHLLNLMLHVCVCDLIFRLANECITSMSERSIEAARRKSALPEARRTANSKHGVDSCNRVRPDLPEVLNDEKTTPGFVRARTNECENDEQQQQQQQQQQTFGLKPNRIACIASLLFVCHPIHVEAVTSLVGRAELLGALFSLLSFKRMLKYLSASTSSQWQHLLSSSLFALMACLSKENCALTVILINLTLIVWFCLLSDTNPKLQAKCANTDQERKAVSSRMLQWTLSSAVMLALMFVYFALRCYLSGVWTRADARTTATNLVPTFSRLDNPLAQDERQFCLAHASQLLLQAHNKQACKLNNNAASGDKFANHKSSNLMRDAQVCQSDLEAQLECMCSNEQVLSDIVRAQWLTRIYLAAFNLRLLVYPLELSYDWPLSALGGLVQSAFEWRSLAGFATYSSAIYFLMAYWLPLVHAFVKEKIKKISLTKSNINESKAPDETSAHISEDENLSETSSVLSMTTIHSSDSGFADSNERSASPAITSGSSSSSDLASERRAEKASNRRKRLKNACGRNKKPAQKMCIAGDSKHSEQEHLIAWSLIWLIVPFLPASNMLVSVGFLVAERALYLPSAGFCLLVASLLEHLAQTMTSLLASEMKNEKQPSRRHLTFVGQSLMKYLPVKAWDNNSKPFAATVLGLVLPLLILGSLQTIERNKHWINDVQLYTSNLEQSPAKSLANLASLSSASDQAQVAPKASIKLYRQALKLEPQSPELHYNLALTLHKQYLANEGQFGKAADASSRAFGKANGERTTGGGDVHGSSANSDDKSRQIDDPVEFHYRFALKLRPNFALAALNLGAWQYARGKLGGPNTAPAKELQLDEAERTLVNNCATQMNAEVARDFNQHVRTQIECLISGARMRLEALEQTQRASDLRSSSIAAHDGETKQTRSQTYARQGEQSEQTFDRNRSCSKIYRWMQLARAKAKQMGDIELAKRAAIEGLASSSEQRNIAPAPMCAFGMPFGDLSKQMAIIDWIQSKCSERGPEARSLIESARSFALDSQHPIDSNVYIDHAMIFASHNENETRRLLEEAFDIELGKLSKVKPDCGDIIEQHRLNLARLLGRLAAAQHTISNNIADGTLARVELALDAFGPKADDQLLSLAGQLAYDLALPSKSEFFYGRALEAMLEQRLGGDRKESLCSERVRRRKSIGTANNVGESAFCSRLARAHANYGAILQVNGRKDAASEHYRHALNLDPNNSIAATNLKRISKI